VLERGGSSWVDDVNTPDRVEDLDEITRKAFRAAVAELETRLGPSPGYWWWGRLHTLTHVHTIGRAKPFLDRLFGFNVGPFESGGSSTTINNGEYTLSAPFRRVVGPSFRRIVDLSDMNSSQIVLPTGQSGVPRSPHYADQAPLYMSGRYRTTFMDEATVRNTGFRKLVLNPAVK
jgi:penicillin amidase